VSIPVEFNVGHDRAVAGGELEMIAIRRYGIALLFVAIAFVSTLLLQRFFPYPFLFVFFAAVMASAWFGGTKPGFLAVLVSTLLVDYFFLPPFRTFAVDAGDVAYFGSFIVCAVVASWVSSSMRRTEEALRQARDQLEIRVAERTAELQKSIAELREKERQRLLLENEKSALENEKSALSDKLETRKVVDRAKGILQRDLKISEEDAYRTLQRESQQRRRSMREIAESIILNDDLKRGLQ
jgi:K+-sensing histidine kinase KdpD